jgi:hypothetical protein
MLGSPGILMQDQTKNGKVLDFTLLTVAFYEDSKDYVLGG